MDFHTVLPIEAQKKLRYGAITHKDDGAGLREIIREGRTLWPNHFRPDPLYSGERK